MKITLSDLAKITEMAYRKANYPEEQIPLIVEVLSYAQWRGNFQSLLQIVGPGIPVYRARAPMQIVKESPISCLIDGNDNIGICAMKYSMELVLQKAKTLGFGIAGSFNTAPPGTAALGYYVRKIAEHGLIAFAFCGASKKVAPHGGYQSIFGSNPIAVGLPSLEKPIVIDMATSIMPIFKVLEAQLKSQSLPKNSGYDKAGNPTNDPKVVLQEGGSLTMFSPSPKAFSLSFLVEALTGPLVGGAFATIGDAQHNWGNLLYAFDPELLAGREVFMEQMAELRKAIKSSHTLPGIQEIFLPGEMAEKKAAAVLQQGWIELDDIFLVLTKM